MELACWRPLADRGTDLVLCLDFPGGRAVAGFAELAGNVPVDACFLRLGPVYSGDEFEQPLDIQVDRWVREVLDTGRPVLAVLGFCAGTALATCVADALTEAGSPPPAVLLFDAATVTATTLHDQFVAAIESSTEQLTDDELDGARRWAATLLEENQDDPARIAAELSGRYSTLMAAVAGRLGLDEFFRQELSAGFTGYLRYLLMASAGRLDMRTGKPLFVLSDGYELDVDSADVIRVEVSREELLRDAEVMKLVADLLRGAPPWRHSPR
jgi:hypothetical protein